ncbi:agrin-like [Episyrphus balteatus]|uniref:agrin-like n=1 Tax=Episyrphus balteatus TaxID=286459 RepID=UPI002486B9B2|nr:agrin-like [Episyrphus balteatus]
MKLSTSIICVFVLVIALVAPIQGTFCPCDGAKGQVCGSNKVTYNSRCEFDCTQRQYRQLGKTLNIAKMGPCDST